MKKQFKQLVKENKLVEVYNSIQNKIYPTSRIWKFALYNLKDDNIGGEEK